MAKYNVGDKVKVREWEDMESEYGCWDTAEYGSRFGKIIHDLCFSSNYEFMCGRSYIIRQVNTNPIFNDALYMLGDVDYLVPEKAIILVRKGDDNNE